MQARGIFFLTWYSFKERLIKEQQRVEILKTPPIFQHQCKIVTSPIWPHNSHIMAYITRGFCLAKLARWIAVTVSEISNTVVVSYERGVWDGQTAICLGRRTKPILARLQLCYCDGPDEFPIISDNVKALCFRLRLVILRCKVCSYFTNK